MTKICTACSRQFEIAGDDITLYAKLAIPAPTRCPQCRCQRRLAWRNDRTFYKRKCDKSGEEFVSHFSPNVPFPVYKPSEWYGDSWNALDYGREFDFSRPFFEQWNDLKKVVPHIGIDIVGCENSDFCNYSGYDRNCYLDIGGENNEDCYFNLFVKYSKNCADCTFVYNSELCYEAINCYQCYDVRYSMHLENSNNCYFSFDLKGCKDCLFSSNLRQKQYYIFNQPHTKEEYEAKLKQLNLCSHEKLAGYVAIWHNIIKKALQRDMYIINSENCRGDDIKNSKNCDFVFNVLNCEDSKYLFDVLDAKDCMDLNYSLYKPEVAVELINTLEMKYSAFSMASHHCDNVYYVEQCNNSSNLFGCIGINRGRYCILNKQYTKEEYEALVPRIIEHMKTGGEWGEFFSAELSPNPYNTTAAQEYYPLTKEQALAKGYKWRDQDQTEYQSSSFQIPDDIKDVDQNIAKEILACSDCRKNFRIIAQELNFYKKQGLAVPRKCHDCRHSDRSKARKKRILWPSTCGKCKAKMLSTSDPSLNLKVYCEKCYTDEIR